MRMTVQEMNRFFMLLCAPFLGIMIWLVSTQWNDVVLSKPPADPLELFTVGEQAATVHSGLDKAKQDAVSIGSTIEKVYKQYEASTKEMSLMLQLAVAQATRPEQIFDNRLAAQFGKPTRVITSGNIDFKLYQFTDPNYRGYALKVQLKTDNAMKMVLGKDKVGGSETTLDAVKRYGAIAGINAGGFADDGKSGLRYPLSTTMLNGKYVYGFEPTFENLAFVGMSTDRKLIGGRFSSQGELDRLKPAFGATFVPVLLAGGVKQAIPPQWANSPKRAPRTVIGSFGNDQLIAIVAEGFDERGTSGATLAELQDRLAALRIRDAYNLDGGGSTSLVVEGKVVNHPSDGRLRALPTHFLFFK
ncbi:phosphodiester glycosidase family protein [Paenibacillus koleovorans]|uniref:phosphodiester glycosidase family protein n=1 Tax=Paenibacillus koleovorans TaxID=121608 RepID=UPI000FDBDFEB|nr:phosphodiester glycosidase family protein [Paenibacillus koleovorans]